MKGQYLEDMLSTLPEKNRRAVEETIQKYGANKWWRSDNPLEIAKYQVFEPVLMVRFDLFHEGIEKLLGRPVWTHEFGINHEGLKQEAREAIERLERGESTYRGADYRDKKIADSMNQIIDYADRNNKKVLFVKHDGDVLPIKHD